MIEVTHFFEGKPIRFEVSSGTNIKVNASDIVKIFHKPISDFLETDIAKGYFAMDFNTEHLNESGLYSWEDLIVYKNEETWMYILLALAYAGWLDVNLEVWFAVIMFQIMDDYRNGTI